MNRTLIPARAFGGWGYRFVDRPLRGTHLYRLEAIGRSGRPDVVGAARLR